MEVNVLLTLAIAYAARPPRADEEPTGAAVIDGATVAYVAEPAYRRCLHQDDCGYALFVGGSRVGWARDRQRADARLRRILGGIVLQVEAGVSIADALAAAADAASEEDDRVDEMTEREIVRSWGG